MICPKCGAQNIEGVQFCGSCGTTLENTDFQETQNNSENKLSHPQVSFDTPYGGPLNGGIVKPKNYLTESIIVTIISTLCCSCSLISTVLGIIAIVKASNVDSSFNAGNHSLALENSLLAKKLTIWSAVIAVVWTIVVTILYFAFLGTLIDSAGGIEQLKLDLGL